MHKVKMTCTPPLNSYHHQQSGAYYFSLFSVSELIIIKQEWDLLILSFIVCISLPLSNIHFYRGFLKVIGL